MQLHLFCLHEWTNWGVLPSDCILLDALQKTVFWALINTTYKVKHGCRCNPFSGCLLAFSASVIASGSIPMLRSTPFQYLPELSVGVFKSPNFVLQHLWYDFHPPSSFFPLFCAGLQLRSSNHSSRLSTIASNHPSFRSLSFYLNYEFLKHSKSASVSHGILHYVVLNPLLSH